MTLWAVLPSAIGLPNSDTAKPTDAEVRQAVGRSVVYLKEEAVDWIRTYKCASRHHGGLGIWSLNEAASRGINVDKAALNELTDWILEDPVRSIDFFNSRIPVRGGSIPISCNLMLPG